MTAEEKTQARRQKMVKIEREFFKLVDLSVAAKKTDIDSDVVEVISKYWMLKRRAGGNKPLLSPRSDDETSTIRGEDTERDRMKQLVNIRQDLERVRNLAYMVSRREKMSRTYVKMREQVLEKQLAILAVSSGLPPAELSRQASQSQCSFTQASVQEKKLHQESS